MRLPADPCRMLGGSKKYKRSPSLRLDDMPSRDSMQARGVYHRSGYLYNRQKLSRKPLVAPPASNNQWALAFFGLIGDTPLPADGVCVFRPKRIFTLCIDGQEVCSFINTLAATNALLSVKAVSRKPVTLIFNTRG